MRAPTRGADTKQPVAYELRIYRKLLLRFLFFTRCLWNIPQCAQIFQELRRAETVIGPYFYLLHFGFIDALTYTILTGTAPAEVVRQQQRMASPEPPGEGYAARLSAFDAACEHVWFTRPISSAVAAANRGSHTAKAIADRGSGIPGRRRRQRLASATPAPTEPSQTNI